MSVVCLGEILVDCLGDARLPGGAPANVASHAAALGENSVLVSRIGCDADGETLEVSIRQRGVRALLQRDEAKATGLVEIRPGPRYEIYSPAAWDFIEPADDVSAAVAGAGSVVFGTLAQRHPVSRQTIRASVAAARGAEIPVLCDLNLRPPFFDEETVLWSLRHCDVLKINREELDVVSGLLGAVGNAEDLFGGLMREFSVARGVLTLGEEGALFFEDGDFFRQPAQVVARVSDPVGAGDAFAAVIAVALVRGLPLRLAASPAAALAAFVVSQCGAMPELPTELVVRINAMLGA